MQTPMRHFIYLMLASSLCLFLFLSNALAQEKILKVEAKPPYEWLHRGLLFFKYTDSNSRAHFLYCGSDNYLKPIVTIQQFSNMMREELDTSHAAEEFVRKRLLLLLPQFVDFSSGKLIDIRYLQKREGLPDEFWDGATRKDREKALEILRQYAKPEVVVTGRNWSAKLWVVKREGGVEAWEVSGTLAPYSVEKFTTTVVQPKGTIVRMPPTPGDLSDW